MTETSQVLLQHHLKKLRLPTFLGEYAKLARQCAGENKDHIQYLLRLSELELRGGHRPPIVEFARRTRAGANGA